MRRREQVLTTRPTTVFSFTLDGNEINKITQAHRVTETGRRRPAVAGRPVTIARIVRALTMRLKTHRVRAAPENRPKTSRLKN